MPSTKTTLDRMAAEIAKIVQEYGNSVTEATGVAVEAAAKQAQKALRSSAPKRTGKYARGWKTELERGRMYTAATIYNADAPGLAHLLEFGHVSKNGTGRTFEPSVPAHPHIAAVETEVVEGFEKELEARINDI